MVLKKLNTSIFPLVAVSVGPLPPGHLTLLGHVMVRAVPSAVSIQLKPIDVLLDDGGFDMVTPVILEFNEVVNKLPLVKFSVTPLDTILTGTTFSVYLELIDNELLSKDRLDEVVIVPLLVVTTANPLVDPTVPLLVIFP